MLSAVPVVSDEWLAFRRYKFQLLFVCVDALRPSQQCFSHVGTFPGLNQY